jgi:hypothetical protein
MVMKEIKRFITSITIVVILVSIVELIVNISFGYLLDNMPQTQAQASRTQYALKKSNADCVIIGSSRASEHYVSNIIADSIGMTVYNAGRDAHGIAYSDCIIHEIFNRCPPKVVILEYDDGLLCTSDHINVNDLKPYYGKMDYTTGILNMCNNWNFKISMLSSLYRYNNFPIRLFEGYIKPRDVFDGYCSRGEHHISDKPITKALELKEDENLHTNRIGLYCLDDIIRLCEVFGSRLILVTSPKYSEYYSNNPLLKSIVKGKSGICVINDMNIPGFHLHPEWFSDHNHLNDAGAVEFSCMLGAQLKKVLQ